MSKVTQSCQVTRRVTQAAHAHTRLCAYHIPARDSDAPPCASAYVLTLPARAPTHGLGAPVTTASAASPPVTLSLCRLCSSDPKPVSRPQQALNESTPAMGVRHSIGCRTSGDADVNRALGALKASSGDAASDERACAMLAELTRRELQWTRCPCPRYCT